MSVSQKNRSSQDGGKKILAGLLIVIPSAIFAITPIYNIKNPTLFGLSFYYWFETVWLVVCAVMFFGAARILNSLEGDEQ